MIDNLTSELLVEQKNNIVFLKINRPKTLNAININIIRALNDILDYCAINDDIVAIIIEGEGRAFSSGGDIVGAYKAKQNGDNFVDFFLQEYLFNIKLHNFSKPYISFYDGIVMGGGIGNSIYGSYRIATENTLWAMPEASIGFFTDVGASYFTQKLDLYLALYICLTGARLKAADSIALGFATHYINSQKIEEFKNELMLNLQNKKWNIDTTNVFSIINETLKSYKTTLEKTSFTEDKIKLLEKCFTSTNVQDILNKLSIEQKQNNKFASDILESFNLASPLSLLIIFKHISESRGLTLEECIKKDNIIMSNMLDDSDFYEGVRAILIDKDKNPNWRYKNINDIDETIVANYFNNV